MVPIFLILINFSFQFFRFVKRPDLLLDRRYTTTGEMTSPLRLKVVSIAGALSSAEASLCCREAGEKETEGARGIVHRALFIGTTQRESLRRRQSREDRKRNAF